MAFPNQEQRRVIEHRGKPLVVLAGPGTGKTRTIQERMVQLLREDRERRVVFITFTRSSMRDTAQKVSRVLGEEEPRQDGTIPRISTLHGFAKSLVHMNLALLGLDRFFPVPVKRQGEQQLLMSEAMADIGTNGNPGELAKLLVGYRSTLGPPVSCGFSEQDIRQANARFEELLRFYGALDMEGVVQEATRLLSDDAARLAPMFLHVDEFQDLNPNDQRFVDTLVSAGRHQIVVVGDDAQSIYGFRHAFPEGIRSRFDDADWEGVRLLECHRLPLGVLRAANALVAGQGFYGTEMRIPERGQLVATYQCTRNDVERDKVAALIKVSLAEGSNRSGGSLKAGDIMILCPTNRIADEFASTLRAEHDIPAKVVRKGMIPEDVWRLVLLLRVVRSDDNLALRQWLNVLNVEPPTIETLRRDAEKERVSLFHACRRTGSTPLRRFLEMLDPLRESRRDLIPVLDALRQFPHLDVSDEVLADVGLPPEGSESDSTPSANQVIQKVYENYGVLDVEEAEPSEDAISVATLHSSKGLEAEIVFLVRLQDRFLPMQGREKDEERRVLYVGMTRAASQLILSFPERFDAESGAYLRDEAMSPFLSEIREYLDVQRVRRTDL